MLRGSVGCRGPGHGEEVFLAGDRIKGPARDQLADELAAFANSSGGVVVLGVSDEPRAVTGIPLEHLDALERYVSEIANDSITPPVVPLIEKLELPDADGRMRPVLKVEIPRGFFVHQSPGGYLHRVGSSKRQMEPAVLARLFEQRSQSRVGQFDRQVVAEASLDDLDARLVDRFRGEISGDDRTTALSKLDLIREDEKGVLRPTVAGVLLGTRQPQPPSPWGGSTGPSTISRRSSRPSSTPSRTAITRSAAPRCVSGCSRTASSCAPRERWSTA